MKTNSTFPPKGLHPVIAGLLVALAIALFIAVLTAISCGAAAILMVCWNWVLAALFGLPSLTFTQAFGVLVLMAFVKWMVTPARPAK